MRPLPRQHLLNAALAAAFGSVLTVWAPVASAQASGQAAAQVFEVKVPSQALGAALNEFSRQTGVQVFAAGEVVAGTSSHAVEGKLTVDQALRQMLAGTSLEATRTASGGLAIRRAADAPNSQGTLPAVQVVANAEESPTGPVSGYAARRSSTATKTDTPLIEVPQSISVIGREEMDARGVQDVMEAIRYTPGVTTNTYGPDNRGWEYILLRGFSTSSNGVYRDGLAQPAFGPTYYLTEPYALERVEVLRGPSSMVFGQGDAGGIVNRVSKQPTGERIREIEVQYGSYQRKQLAFDLGDRIGNTDLSYRVVGVGLDSNDQDKYPDGRKLNRTRSYIAPSVRWQPNSTTSLTVFGEFLKNNTAEDPYYLTQDYVLYPVKVGDYSFGRLKQSQSAIGYRFETALNDTWTLRQNFRYSQIALDRRAVWAGSLGNDRHTLSRVARTWNDPVDLATLDTSVQGKLQYGSVQHTVLLGVDYSDQKGKQRRFRGAAPTLDIWAPVYGQAVAMPTIPMTDLAQSTRQTGFYAQDQIKFGDNWIVTLGGRHDEVRQLTDNYLARSHTRRSDSAFSGRAGISYLFGNGWAPYMSYTTSFLPNSGVDANNQPFKPSSGKQVEVGVKFQPAGSRTSYTAAVFDLRKTNVVTYDPTTSEGRQIGKQRSRGLELEAKGELAPGLNISAAYTWLDMKVLNSADADEIGKIPPLVPKQTASVWLDYTMGNGLGFGGGVRYIGKRQNDEHNTTYERGVTLLDAAAHYERGPWRFALNISNLANKQYNSICYHGQCYQGTLRTATLTARYKF
ncbi:TonB-dependent siderophore receptor [Variovorax sp. Varisp36]|uniref:TonB-dependent siderophore receptor n=1 Tax=Variovorax sp. Varisp36 TaxID=3243031 RepID=UPI0039A50AF4